MASDAQQHPRPDLRPVPDAPPAADGPALPARRGTEAGVATVDNAALQGRMRDRGVNPWVYWTVRVVLQPFFLLWFRMSRVGREHIPAEGPVLFAANHRSFLDPFVIGCMTRRPLYFVAKEELFRNRMQRWILNSLGAFPVARGTSDAGAMDTARTILERGDCVVIFPEGTRVRPGRIGAPKRGVGRLALQTGAPVVPVAVLGTTHIRTGWKVRPHKVRLRAGRPLRFPRVEEPTPELANSVTERIWPCIAMQWDWLGGHSAERGVGVDPELLHPDLVSDKALPRAERPEAARRAVGAG